MTRLERVFAFFLRSNFLCARDMYFNIVLVICRIRGIRLDATGWWEAATAIAKLQIKVCQRGNNSKDLLLPLKGQGVREELLLNRLGLQEPIFVSCAFGVGATAKAETRHAKNGYSVPT